jgi:hypothetical protein
MSRLPGSIAGGVALLLLFALRATPAQAGISIGAYSQEASSETAQAGGSISYAHGTGGGERVQVSGSPSTGTGTESGLPGSQEVASTSSGASANPSTQTQCVRAQESAVSPCYGVVPVPVATPPTPAPGARRTVVNPALLAASEAARLALVPGRIQASPSAQTAGLTGAASWFWLEPSPAANSLSIGLGGEHVTVSASVSSVQWNFGDNTSRSAGPGVPYKPEATPAGSVRHVFQTRCLPGDRGHDPNVLASCGSGGYTVTASVLWAISYQATGPITSAGALPARTTTTSTVYPVSEARAFLTKSGGGGG